MLRIACVLVLSACLLQGCLSLAVSAVGMASSAGFDHVMGGGSYKTFSQSLPRMRLATLKTLRRMDFDVVKDQKQKAGWKIRGKVGQRFVDIELESLTRKATHMSVLVAQGDVFNPDKATGAEIISQTAETISRDDRRAWQRRKRRR